MIRTFSLDVFSFGLEDRV